MKTEHLTIKGMSCGHCVMSVKKELGKLQDLIIEDVQVGRAVVRYDESKVTRQELEHAIDEAGYKVVERSS